MAQFSQSRFLDLPHPFPGQAEGAMPISSKDKVVPVPIPKYMRSTLLSLGLKRGQGGFDGLLHFPFGKHFLRDPRSFRP